MEGMEVITAIITDTTAAITLWKLTQPQLLTAGLSDTLIITSHSVSRLTIVMVIQNHQDINPLLVTDQLQEMIITMAAQDMIQN